MRRWWPLTRSGLGCGQESEASGCRVLMLRCFDVWCQAPDTSKRWTGLLRPMGRKGGARGSRVPGQLKPGTEVDCVHSKLGYDAAGDDCVEHCSDRARSGPAARGKRIRPGNSQGNREYPPNVRWRCRVSTKSADCGVASAQNQEDREQNELAWCRLDSSLRHHEPRDGADPQTE